MVILDFPSALIQIGESHFIENLSEILEKKVEKKEEIKIIEDF